MSNEKLITTNYIVLPIVISNIVTNYLYCQGHELCDKSKSSSTCQKLLHHTFCKFKIPNYMCIKRIKCDECDEMVCGTYILNCCKCCKQQCEFCLHQCKYCHNFMCKMCNVVCTICKVQICKNCEYDNTKQCIYC